MVKELIAAKSKNISLWGNSNKKPEYSGLPIKFFEERTYLERVAEWFTNFPYFLAHEKISKNKDPLYRFKKVVYAILSTIYMTVKPAKPFNPILGETYQGFMCLNYEKTKHYVDIALDKEVDIF